MATGAGEAGRIEADDGDAVRRSAFPPSYVQRLAQRVMARRERAAVPRWHSMFLLVPPGTDTEALARELCAALAIAPRLLSGATTTPALLASESERGVPVVLLDPQALAPGDFENILAMAPAPSGTPWLILGHVPLWSSPRTLARAKCGLLSARELCFEPQEFQALRMSMSAAAARSGDNGEEDPYRLFELTQGWPLLCSAAIAALAEPSLTPKSFSLAQMPAVRDAFARDWLPSIRERYPWLVAVNRLPLVNLDLLGFLFDEPFAQVRECLALGWVEPCPKTVGSYQVNSALDVLLRYATAKEESRDVLERAALWYRREGHAAEAVECMVAVLETDELAGILEASAMAAEAESRASPAPRRAGHGGSMREAASVARGALGKASVGFGPRWAKALLGRVNRQAAVGAGGAVERDSRAPSGPAEAVAPAEEQRVTAILDHIAVAFAHHRSQDAKAVASAISQAVAAGIDRESLSEVLDFVDLHIRPLLRNEGSPLQLALRDLRHSAPAREVVAAQYKQLNHRELQILQRVCEGYKNREISEQLGLELSTIKWYVTGIYEKLQVRNRTQAVAKAQALRLFG